MSSATRNEPSGWAIGWAMFAGTMLLIGGTFQVIAGLAGIIEDEFYAVTPNYIFEFDATTWGWIHLIWGVILILSGVGIFTGNLAARLVGVVVAAIAGIMGFAFIPLYPIWGIMMAAISVAVIWALTAHGRDIAQV